MGAEVAGWDDRPRRATAADRASRCAIPTREIGRFDALVLSPGIPHRLPAPHRGGGARRRGRHADPVAMPSCCSRRCARPARPRASSASPAPTANRPPRRCSRHILQSAGLPVAAGGNLGPAALALPLLRRRRRLRAGDVVLHVGATRHAALRCGGDAEPQPPTISTAMATWRAMSPPSAQIFDRQIAGDPAVIGIDDAPSRAMAMAARRAGARHASPGDQPGRCLVRRTACCATRTARSCRWPRRPPCPARTTRRTRPPPRRWRWRSAWRAQTIAARHRQLSRPAAPPAARRHDRRRRLRQRQQGDQRRRRRARAGLLRPHRLDRRRHGQGGRHRAARAVLPAHRPRAADRPRRAATSPRTLAAHGVPHSIAGTLDAAVPAALRGRAREPARRRRAALAGLRQLRPVHRLRGARRPLRRTRRRARRRTGGPPDADALARRQLRPRPLVVDGRPLDAGRHRRADRLRLRHDAGGQPGGGRAHPRQSRDMFILKQVVFLAAGRRRSSSACRCCRRAASAGWRCSAA